MTAWAWAALAGAASLITAALGDLVSEELRGWLDLAPNAILRLAATLLDPAQRETIYKDEWHPELCYILRGTESRPITRLIRGITLRVSPHTPFLPPLRAHPANRQHSQPPSEGGKTPSTVNPASSAYGLQRHADARHLLWHSQQHDCEEHESRTQTQAPTTSKEQRLDRIGTRVSRSRNRNHGREKQRPVLILESQREREGREPGARQ